MRPRQRLGRYPNRRYLLACSGVSVAVTFASGAASVAPSSYDSGGFDTIARFSTTFTNANDAGVTGTLRGQDAAIDPWGFSTGNPGLPASSTGTARVITAAGGAITGGAVFSGTQSLRVDRISADNRWAPPLTMSAGPSTNVVKVSWEMNTAVTNANNGRFGPFFGIEGYANSSGARLGGAGLDATTGEFLYEDPSLGLIPVNVNPGTGFGFQPAAGWHQFELDFNYQSGTYTAMVDNVIQASGVQFLTTGLATFTSAQVCAIAAVPPAFSNNSGTAYFDNYTVTAGPVAANWGLSVGGSWNTAGNWKPTAVPNGAVDRVNFASGLLVPSTITLDANQTAGQITFNSSLTYTIATGAVSQTLTIDDTGDSAGVNPLITVSAGNHVISAPVVLAAGVTVNTASSTSLSISGDITGNGGLTKSGAGTLTLGGTDNYGSTTVGSGTLTIASGALVASTTITANAGTTLNVDGSVAVGATVNANGSVKFSGATGAASLSRAFSALAVGNGAVTKVLSSTLGFFPPILHPTSLTFGDGTAKLDLTNNELIVTLPLTTIRSNLQTGAIFTSTPASGFALGYLDLGSGVSEVRFTLQGDTNLDGIVGVSDLGNLATYYGKTSGAIWGQGDSDRNGTVDVADLGALATHYGNSLAGGPSNGSSLAGSLAIVNTDSSSAVPEPAALGMVSFAAISLLARGRRQ